MSTMYQWVCSFKDKKAAVGMLPRISFGVSGGICMEMRAMGNLRASSAFAATTIFTRRWARLLIHITGDYNCCRAERHNWKLLEFFQTVMNGIGIHLQLTQE